MSLKRTPRYAEVLPPNTTDAIHKGPPVQKISYFSAFLILSVSLSMVASFAIANPAVTMKDTAYPIPASGVYFVSPAGNDANSGTSLSTPFRTIQKAVQVAPSGSTIVIRAGTYRESITSLSKKLTFQPYPHEQ